MNEHRHNWKENISKEARARATKRHSLLVALDEVREEIKNVGLDFERYDDLKAQQRQIVSELAIL